MQKHVPPGDRASVRGAAEGRASARPLLGDARPPGEDMQKHDPPTLGLKESKQQRRAEAEQRKAEAKIKRDHDKRVHEIEMHILSLEGRQRELTAELEKPETYNAGGAAMELNRELLAVSDELARVTAEWEALASVTTFS